MTDSIFSQAAASDKFPIAKTNVWTQLASSISRRMSGELSAKNLVDVEGILKAQVRREAARCCVDKLLR